MRLVYVADANSIHSYRWIGYFAGRGYEIQWVSRVPSIFPPLPSVPLHVTPPSRLAAGALLKAVLAVRRVVRSVRPDVLHAHYVGANGLVAAACGFRPLAVTAWGSDVLFAGRSRWAGPLVRWVLRRADVVTCDADHMIDAMVALGVPRARIRLVYFGMDTERFSPAARSPGIRADLGIGDAPAVISLRHLEPLYDVESLVRAVPRVVEALPEARVVILGGGSLASALRALAESLGVSHAVRFVGTVPNDRLPAYLASMDVYVSTSLSDGGIAASTAEAMACGLPVVITDFGENGRWVVDGKGGFLVPLRNPAILAEKLVFLLRHPELRAEWGAINRETIRERNDYRVEMARMAGIYTDLIEIGHPARGRGGR